MGQVIELKKNMKSKLDTVLFLLSEYSKVQWKFTLHKTKYQSSVAEWLGRWANLGVITTTELLGGRGFESHSRHE